MKGFINSCKDFIFYLEVGGNSRGIQVGVYHDLICILGRSLTLTLVVALLETGD